MIKKLMILSLASIFSVSAMAGVQYKVEGKQEITFKKINKNKFEKISSSNNGTETLSIGSRVLGSGEIVIPDDGKAMSLEITGKGIVKFIDESVSINAEVEASVEKTFLGRVKSITIVGNNYQNLYEKAIKDSATRAAAGIVKKLNLGNAVDLEYSNSDFTCKEVEGKDLLKCEVESEFVLNFVK